MPFGFHLTMDTLPSGGLQVGGFRSALAGFRLSLSCPFRLLHTFQTPSSPRGITPAFGYGAPHSSARGTSTLLSNALLSAHYAVVRLPDGVHEGLIAHRLPPPARDFSHHGRHRDLLVPTERGTRVPRAFRIHGTCVPH